MNRAQLPDEVFGIPQERKYPMPDKRHTISAIKLFNHVEDKYEEQLAKAIIKNMKKYDIDSSMIGDNNRLKKYLPKDMVTESSRIRYISLSKKERSDIITITKSLKDPWKKEFNDIYLEKIVYKKIKYYSGIPIGFVIIRAITKDNENRGSITVAISPNHEGKNLGYTLVKEAIAFYDKCSFLDSIEYRVAKNNKRSISLVDRLGFTYISDKDNYTIYRLSKDMISESTDIPTPVIIKTVKRVTLDYADRVPFGLHINIQKIDKNKKYIGVLILDGPQEYRDADDARDFLKSIAEDVKYRLNKAGNRVSKIDIGDGDEGCIYIYFKTGIFNIHESDNAIDISPIIDMQKELSKFEYGVPTNGKIKKVSEIDFGKEYKTLTDKEFYRYKAGVCWDFANYQEIELSKIYGKGNVQNYYFIVDKAPNYPTHTITIIKLDGYYYYLESSWGKMMGVYRDKNLSKILNTVAYKLAQEEKDVTYVECRKYNGYNRLSKLSPNEYMNKMNNAQKINVSLKYSELEKVTSKMISENYLSEDAGKIKNIIFDLGNVLVSTNMEDLMAVDPDIPNDKINYIMSQWYKDEDDPIGLDEFKSIIPARLKEASKFIPKLFEYNIRCVNPFDYTIPLIDKLKAAGYNVYFLSNWSKWSYELLDRYHKFDFLEKMNGGVWSWQTGCMKPNERIYRILLNKYNLNPEECVFFDDLKDNVEAANGVGIKGFLFDRLDFDIDNFFGKNIYGIVEESGILDDEGKRNVNKNTNPYNSKKVSKSITSTAFKLSLKHLFDKKASDQYEWVRNEYIPKIIDKCKTDADIKYMRDDSYIAQQQMLTLLRNIEAVENNDTAKMKRLSKSFIKKVQSGKINSKDVRRHYNWLRGEGRQLLNKKAKEIRNSIKESTTAGTIVGSNQLDSIYIVNYMQNNVFSGHKENRLGICKKGMKDLHIFGGKYDRFHYVSDLDEFKEEASDIKMYRYTGTPKNSFYEIIEDTVNDFDLYKLLTGRDLPDRSFIDYDSEFIQEECFLDTLDAIRECTEAGLLSLTENKYPVPILTETVQGRPYNYYRDLDGVFIQHEVTKIRSKSYRDKNDIPEAQVNAVKRGYLY